MVSQILKLAGHFQASGRCVQQARTYRVNWRVWVVASLALVSAVNMSSWAYPNGDATRIAVQNDAYALLDLIEQQYAYPYRYPQGLGYIREELGARIPMLYSRNDLIAFSQTVFHTLYDHHSITGAGLPDAYGLVPSFADLWIEQTDRGYEILDVRKGSPALKTGLRPGCRLVSVEGQPIENAVAYFIGDYARDRSAARKSYAARVLATGRRDRMRRLGLDCDGLQWTLELPNLYQVRLERDKGLVSVETRETAGKRIGVVRFNDSLGLPQTVSAFDEALASLGPVSGLVIDLRDTASGGNTLVARGILSRFVSQRTPYQRHILPSDQRDFGVERSWLEEVSPRGMRVTVPVAVVSGRWTASMGEGLTIAFDALGYATFGTGMAGLLGGITDHHLPETDVMVKLTTEQLVHVDGTPRELFRPRGYFPFADAPDASGADQPLQAALDFLAGQS